jgi:alcohol dehydrogenase class IV
MAVNMAPFSIARLPRIIFGAGEIGKLADQIGAFGSRALVVTGRSSFRDSPRWAAFGRDCAEKGIKFETVVVDDEPSPDLVDATVAQYRDGNIDAVAAIGGGSALDAAKAIAGLLPTGNSVMDHIEGVGRGIAYRGPSVPFIAAPTTAGTGSEATKNAVLSRRGADGFKKSFRDDALVAQVAIVDPELLETCPAGLIAANGMDAFTQLLESYVSVRANAMTDALAWSGLEAFGRGFFDAWIGAGKVDDKAAAGRADTAYASLMSGITLAQVGLGSVHGLASPLGAFFPIPHGVVCGTLVGVATEVNIRALKARRPDSPALEKYARVGRLLCGEAALKEEDALAALTETLSRWIDDLGIGRLGEFGMTEADVATAAAAAMPGMKSNPVMPTEEEVSELLQRRL